MNEVVEAIGKWLVKNAPRLLLATGIGCSIGAAIGVGKVSPKAKDVWESAPVDENDSDVRKTWTRVKAVVPLYGPAIALEATSIVCVVASQGVMTKRNAALAAAASVMETALSDRSEAMVEKLTKGQLEKVDAEIGRRRMSETPYSEELVEQTGSGETLFYDSVTGRYFRSSIEKVNRSEADVAKLLIDELIVPLNTWYERIGLEDVKIGNDIGWFADKDPRLDVRMSSMLHPETQEPVCVLTYDVAYLKRW